jgi:hypothetical protein
MVSQTPGEMATQDQAQPAKARVTAKEFAALRATREHSQGRATMRRQCEAELLAAACADEPRFATAPACALRTVADTLAAFERRPVRYSHRSTGIHTGSTQALHRSCVVRRIEVAYSDPSVNRREKRCLFLFRGARCGGII